jgi:hypothetical protein
MLWAANFENQRESLVVTDDDLQHALAAQGRRMGMPQDLLKSW